MRAGWPRIGCCSALGLSLGLACGSASSFPTERSTARSLSGQFIVHAANNEVVGAAQAGFARDGKHLPLEPALTTIACERIKDALAQELGWSGQWQHRIYLSLHRALTAGDEITLLGSRYKDGWSYRVDIPNPVEKTRFVRAIVQVLLLEQANRTAGERSAEIPLWLSEGLAQQILATHGHQVLLAPPQLQVNRLTLQPGLWDRRHANAATLARRGLDGQPPLSLGELSWPKEDQLAGPDARTYELSAQLLVAELLQFRDGRECTARMLGELAGCLNWQTAFLRAFQAHFQRQLDFEKWWTLQTVHYAGREPGAAWSPDDSWSKLDELLQVPAEVRRGRTELPQMTSVPLAKVIRDWPFARQEPVLRGKLTELFLARQRVAPELGALVDDYRQLLAGYLEQRAEASQILGTGKARAPNARAVVMNTLKQLNALERLRANARVASPSPAPEAAVPVEPPPEQAAIQP